MVEIKEIRIKKVNTLSETAQQEVIGKLSQLAKAQPKFNYQGYAKVSYVEHSPLSVYSVDPIEGTIVDFSEYVFNKIKK
jgi:hypothetical protein